MATKTPLLNCPYTGADLVIERIPDTPLFHCVGGFDPCEWISGVHYEELKKKLRMRAGKPGLVRDLKCPYLGTPVRILEHLGLIRADGAFSPRVGRWFSRQEALWAVSFRDGVAPDFPQKLKIVVGDIRLEMSDPMEGYGCTTGKIKETVEEIMQ